LVARKPRNEVAKRKRAQQARGRVVLDDIRHPPVEPVDSPFRLFNLRSNLIR
jgi:hypothetical protein